MVVIVTGYTLFATSQNDVKSTFANPGLALAGAGANARPGRGAPLSSDFMTSSCSVNCGTIVVERRYTVQH